MNSKLINFHNQIREIKKLKDLLIDDFKKSYRCTSFLGSKNMTHLHKCVLKTRNYKFLNEYIDEYLNQNPDKVDDRNKQGHTALMLATVNTNYRSTEETVKILLKHNANVNLQDNEGMTALMHAASLSGFDSTEETVKILLYHKADINMQDKRGFTSLLYSTISHDLYSTYETSKILIKYSADVNIQNDYGKTALMYSIYDLDYKNDEIIKMLINQNADINLQDDDGMTILMCLIYFRSELKQMVNEIIELLLDKNVKINLKNKINETAISIAFKQLKIDAINILLSNRRKFIEQVTINKKQILTNGSKFWKLKTCDYKIIYSLLRSFHDIITFM